ncbi:hypothetical protein [Actinoplanes friuliensis]|uniref:hypothetical protein n=1 Tax=Actinoplanes friuliensis TaxID=196914 RepID=UPI0004142E45|nr:hypothetical protein [Actinoplanes friuliensis]
MQATHTVEEIINWLQAAVWDLSCAGEVEPEQAVRLHQAARLLAAASDRVLQTTIQPVAD